MFDELRRHLFEWLPRQPWFDAVDEEIEEVKVVRTEVIRREWPIVMWAPVEVTIDGVAELVQTVLALAPVVPDVVPERSILGEVPSGDGAVMAYGALDDPVAAAAFVEHAGDRIADPTVNGLDHAPWLTVVRLGHHWDLTLYRRLHGGAHPDVELTSALAESTAGVRPPAAVWRKQQFDLAAVRRNARRGPTVGRVCRDSVDELLRRRCQPRENPLDVVETITELGRGLAAIHIASADRFGTESASGGSLADALVARLPRQLDDQAAALVATAYRRLSHADDLGSVIRVHGNLGVDAAERVRNGWVISRFGTDPHSELRFAQRPSSPLLDIAGLIHGFAATAGEALAVVLGAEHDRVFGEPVAPDPIGEAERRELAVLAEAWEERAVDALIAGYTSDDAVHRLLPVERISRDALLTLFELELSVRDVVRSQVGSGLLRIPVEAVDEIPQSQPRRRW